MAPMWRATPGAARRSFRSAPARTSSWFAFWSGSHVVDHYLIEMRTPDWSTVLLSISLPVTYHVSDQCIAHLAPSHTSPSWLANGQPYHDRLRLQQHRGGRREDLRAAVPRRRARGGVQRERVRRPADSRRQHRPVVPLRLGDAPRGPGPLADVERDPDRAPARVLHPGRPDLGTARPGELHAHARHAREPGQRAERDGRIRLRHHRRRRRLHLGLRGRHAGPRRTGADPQRQPAAPGGERPPVPLVQILRIRRGAPHPVGLDPHGQRVDHREPPVGQPAGRLPLGPRRHPEHRLHAAAAGGAG